MLISELYRCRYKADFLASVLSYANRPCTFLSFSSKRSQEQFSKCQTIPLRTNRPNGLKARKRANEGREGRKEGWTPQPRGSFDANPRAPGLELRRRTMGSFHPNSPLACTDPRAAQRHSVLEKKTVVAPVAQYLALIISLCPLLPALLPLRPYLVLIFCAACFCLTDWFALALISSRCRANKRANFSCEIPPRVPKLRPRNEIERGA